MTAMTLPFAASGPRRAPDLSELATGFPCGPADQELFNFLNWYLTGQLGYAAGQAGVNTDNTDLTTLYALIQKLAGKTKPLYGVHALPAATMTVPNDVTTDITSYGTVTNGLLTSTFSGGVLTVGTGDDGFYLLTDWLGTNLSVGTSGYGYSGTIGLSTNGGSSYTSIGGMNGYSNSSAVLWPFFGCSVVQKLDVGNKVKLALRQNLGSSQNAPCGFGAIFLGK